jgi:hypothetical protein
MQPPWWKPEEKRDEPDNPLLMDRLTRDEFHGLYWEEVGKLVDGIEAEIMENYITNRADAIRQLMGSVDASEWVTENENWAIHTLLFTQHACEGLKRGHAPRVIRADMPHLYDGQAEIASGWEPPDPPDDVVFVVKGDSFPFTHFAKFAMRADAHAELIKRDAYKHIPHDCNVVVEDETEPTDEMD